ncbi:MAG: HipA domain-containing protein [Desulfobacterales bacterium]|nr:HipA domain-containing protein [Desulfobacterales bacterium]
MDKNIFVHIELAGKTYFVGRLWIKERRGIETSTFEYSSKWRMASISFSLEPALLIGEGSYHTGKALFGSIGDSAPDRWGCTLMNRQEARRAKTENRNARRLKPSDYLLMVDDRTRQGALRFSENQEGPFLALHSTSSIPPLINLGNLLNASQNVIMKEETDQNIKDLFEPGSSLGGARPKAVVLDKNNKLLIAKLPSPKDEWDVPLWEFLSLHIAKKAGINVPGFNLEKVLAKNVLLLDRFDRDIYNYRIPFLSAMSMLNAQDHETRSYLEIKDSLIEYGSQTTKDLKELWQRIVLNIMISNVDDHLRNHGFLYDGKTGWILSPVYDLEPTPEHVKARFLKTNINKNDNSASLELAYEVAKDFGLNIAKARELAKSVGEAVKDWKKEALQFGATKQDIEFMHSAFDHNDLKQVLKNKVISTNNIIFKNDDLDDEPEM